MIVCHCEAVSTRAVEAAVLAGAATVDQVRSRTRAATGCGGCVSTLEALLRAVEPATDVAA